MKHNKFIYIILDILYLLHRYMGLVQKDAFRTMIISYLGIILGYLNKGLLFLLLLTTEQIGLVNLILSVGMLFAQLANLGSLYTTWKFFPFFKNQEKKHHGFLPLILIVVLIGISIYTLLAFIFRTEIETLYQERSSMFVSYYIWALPIGISSVLFMVLEVYLRGFYKNIVSVVALEIVMRLGLTVLLVLIYLQFISFDTFVKVHSLLYIIPTIILIVYLYRLKELNLSFSSISISKKFRKILIQYSSFNYINSLGMVLINSMDVMMIAQMIGLRATGVYGTVVFLTSAVQVPYKSIIRISSPLVSDYWKHREFDKMKELYQKVSSVSLVIGLGLFTWVWVNIDFFFSFLKPEFQPGIWVFFFLMMGRLIDMYFGLNGSIFNTSKKYKYDIYFTVFLILAVFFLNLLFIPWWGIIGTAISTSIALIVYNVGRLLFVWFTFKIHPFQRNQFIIIGLALLTILVGTALNDVIANKWIQFCFESTLVVILFVCPIYFFSLEPDTVNFIKKGKKFVIQKLSGKS